MKHNKQQTLTAMFLAVQLVLYLLILTQGGDLLRWCEFGAIALCFLYALASKGDRYITAALGFTVVADFFLVIHTPQQQLAGMVAFLGTQACYAVYLHKRTPPKKLLTFRAVITLAAVAVTVAVLGSKTDALTLVSLCYYANLITNITAAFANLKRNKAMAIALTLFLLCDTVIGLQVASDAYLPIAENGLLYRVIFMPFNLSWFFYLPSQVIAAVNSTKE